MFSYKEIKKVFLYFVSWRLILFVILFFAIKLIPNTGNYLGGGKKLYDGNPYLWAWSNFDGEHYLSIAKSGYRNLQYFFFPAYPLIIKVFTPGNNLISFSIVSQITSSVFFLVGIFGFLKLAKLDFNKNVPIVALILLMTFPTSFYFISSYTESLFFCLCVWSFYFARKGSFWKASLLASLSTATRIVGLAVVVGIAYEYFLQNRKTILNGKVFKNKNIFSLLISPLGLILYMIYLKITTNDYLEFFNNISVFGYQRSTKLVLFPRVFYRYFFKVLPNLNYSSLSLFFTAYLEVIVALLFLVLLVVSWFKLKRSYFVYFLSGYLISTVSGSFSSFPRYALVLFPGFFVMSIYFLKAKPFYKILIGVLFIILLSLSTAFFARGYFVS